MPLERGPRRFPFEGLTIHAIYISGQVTAFNEDTGKNNHLSWGGPTAFVQSWEKSGNMVTGSGEVHNIGTSTPRAH